MKKTRGITLAVAICLVAILALGSLAYFTDSKTVTNEFKVASTGEDTPTADELFSIALYETNADGEQETEGITYENIAPGDVLDKDPTVENTGLYSQWVRVSVTISDATAWKEAMGDADVISVMNVDTANWTSAGDAEEDEEADTITYVFYYNSVLEAGETATLFTAVTIPTYFEADDMVALSSFTISIVADAIQSQNTGDSAEFAFTNYWN